MSEHASDLISRLTDSGLVTHLQVAECWVELGHTQDDARLLELLVSRGLITRWHANQIQSGKAGSFIMGRYKLLGPLGMGGMGQVFRAADTETNAIVAVKVLPKRYATPRGIERFRREGQAALALQHEYIVGCFELGQHGETLFLVMELVDGTDLAVYLSNRRTIAVPEAARIGYEVAQALEYARELGFIHRDIKPSNILLTRTKQVKLGDLGLAKFFGGGEDRPATLTYSGALLGTVDYMAPEQAEDARMADTRSDVYSLGCTLYHCLTGQPPFPQGTTVQKILAHHTRDAQPISAMNGDVPAELSDLIMRRMLAKVPDERLQTPGDVAEALAPWAERRATAIEQSRSAVVAGPRAPAPPGPAPKQATETPLRRALHEATRATPDDKRPGRTSAPSVPAAFVEPPRPATPRRPPARPVSAPPPVAAPADQSSQETPAIDWELPKTADPSVPQMSYKIRIFTGDFAEAGSDGIVTVNFTGTDAESGGHRYEPEHGVFKRGFVFECVRTFPDLGVPYECTVCFEPRGSDPEWFLWKIDIFAMLPIEKWLNTFHFNTWMGAKVKLSGKAVPHNLWIEPDEHRRCIAAVTSTDPVFSSVARGDAEVLPKEEDDRLFLRTRR